MGEFRDLMTKRRAIRDYDDRAVPLSLIRQIIADACEAPSGGNRQPWAFVVVSDKSMIKRLSDESKKNLLEDMKIIKSPIVRMYRPILKDENYNVFYNAPTLIYITGPRDMNSSPADCSLAGAYLMLSAADRGLGTCWIDLGSYIKDQGTLAELGIPEDHKIIATIILGFPKTRSTISSKDFRHLGGISLYFSLKCPRAMMTGTK
jgi:nitroreductase